MSSETPRSVAWYGREILHDGDGPPDQVRSLLFSDVVTAEEAAQHMAGIIDDDQVNEHGLIDSDFDGNSNVVEVRRNYGEEWKRFRVRCRTERKYRAEPEPEQKRLFGHVELS